MSITRKRTQKLSLTYNSPVEIQYEKIETILWDIAIKDIHSSNPGLSSPSRRINYLILAARISLLAYSVYSLIWL